MSSSESAIHSYLCADGYVIRNPASQKHKYYRIGFRNTNKVLLTDFAKKFEKVFGVKPRISKDRVELGSKKIYEYLSEKESFYSHEWKMPDISGDSLSLWLRAFFDCEAWVELQPFKSRAIRVDSVNTEGLRRIRNKLEKLGIKAQIRMREKRDIVRLNICGKENLVKFQKTVGFLHPEKRALLAKAISSYKTYIWEIPSTRNQLVEFIKSKGRKSAVRKEVRFNSILRENLIRLKRALERYNIQSRLLGPWVSGTGSRYYCLSIPHLSLKKVGYGH